MKRYAVCVFYEGKGYYGYQRQLKERTTEGTIIQTLRKTRYIESPEKNNFRSASRTDRYVNALGNVFAFDSEKKLVVEEINASLPSDKSIVCWAYSEVEEDFSPKYSLWKKYWYVIPKEILKLQSSMTIDEIRTVGSHFVGEHDFSLFCKKDNRQTIRKIDKLTIIEQEAGIILEFVANSFLWEQVRRITSYILHFKDLSEELQDTQKLLQTQSDVKALNIEPAKPNRLTLVEHHYENIKWNISKRAREQILEKFENEILELRQKETSITSAHKFFTNLEVK